MKKNAQIAFLILAHNQPGHLHRLVSALDDRGFHFFIHIDAKSDLDAFRIFPYRDNVHFISDRIKIIHSGFSIVTCMLRLMREAFARPEIDYFIFLSGWDYPIKNAAYIRHYLEQNHPRNFISFYPLVGEADFVHNIRKFYFIDLIGKAPLSLRLPLKVIQRLLVGWPGKRDFLPGITPFRGSAWFCINRETTAYILEFVEKTESAPFIHFFQTVSGSDEIFFHTIILNSACAENCHQYPEFKESGFAAMKNENKAYLHYIDWDQKRENPALLDMRDYEKLLSSGALFARKFHEEKSAELLNAIDRMVLFNDPNDAA